MGQIAVAAIAFIAGIAFAQVWPFVVRWVDRRAAVKTVSPSVIDYANYSDRAFTVDPPPSNPNPRRRIGIAERRRMAEMQSLAGPTHQAEVTANNARALS